MKLVNLVRVVIIGFVASTAAGLILITEFALKESFSPSTLSSLEVNQNHGKNRLEIGLTKSKELALSFTELPPVSGIIRAKRNEGFDSEQNSTLEMWKSRLQEIWKSHATCNNDLLKIRYLDAATGEEIVRVNFDSASPINAEIVPNTKLQKDSNRSYFREFQNLKKGEVYVSEFDLNQEFGQIQYPFVPTAKFITPVFDENDKLFGFVTINLNISRMLDSFHDRSDNDTQVVLYDNKGDFILHPNRLLEFGSDLGRPNLVESELSRIVPDLEKYERSGVAEGQAFGKIFFSKSKIEIGPNYTLWSINFQNYDKVYRLMVHVRNTAILLSIAFVIVTIGISILLSHFITTPISKMIAVLATAYHDKELEFPSCFTKEFGDIQNAIMHYRNNWIQSENKLRGAKEEALKTEARTEAKSLFLANMSHEIRTPMNGVLGMTQILQTTELNSQQKECADIIEESANLLLTIIDSILDFSKIAAGKLVIEKIVMRPSKLIEETLALLKPQVENKSIQMSTSIDSEVPEKVIGDPIRIRQILTNLLNNAIKFTEVGKVEIHLSSRNISPTNSELIFRVVDTGIGIESSRLSSIFSAFTQADNSITRKYGGTGLGLTISHQLATIMNATLEVETAPDKGSTFTLVCPVRVALEKRPNEETDSAIERKCFFGEVDFSEIRLLVAEDNEANQLVVRAILSRIGFKFDIVPNGLEVIKALEIERYDAILMDCQMPVMDGYTSTRTIRSSGQPYAGIPIIALTANALDTDIQQSIDAGMDAYIAKPIQISVLQVKIARLLQVKI
jgi:signal transduction histidine kinase/CheY-like chemotaxis protein